MKLNLVLAIAVLMAGCGTGGEDEAISTNCSISGSNNVQVCGNDDSTITASQEQSGSESEGAVITKFLWKPESESTGKLAVLVNPTGVDILVAGSVSESLTDSGASNGFGTTGRSEQFTGCDFGGPVSVQFFKNGELLKTASGATSITVKDGCVKAEVVE